MKKIIILTLLSFYIYSVPTMEGLFRNSQSEEIDKNLVVAEMIIKKKEEKKKKKQKQQIKDQYAFADDYQEKVHASHRWC